MIVVSPKFRDKDIFEKAELISNVGLSLIKRFGKQFDIIYNSDIEWENETGSSVIINEAKHNGVVIYSV